MTPPKKPRRKPRKRFECIVILGGQEITKMIMAPDAESVRAHYTGRGYKVKSVVPYNTAHVKAKNGGGWKVSNAYFNKAVAEFGLKLPVVVQQIGRVGSTNANYALCLRGQEPRGVTVPRGARIFHLVKAKSYHTPEQASQSLWHELTHARQAEDAIRKVLADDSAWQSNAFVADEAWERKVKHQRENFSYEDRPIEREARRTAAAMNQQYKLTLANRG